MYRNAGERDWLWCLSLVCLLQVTAGVSMLYVTTTQNT